MNHHRNYKVSGQQLRAKNSQVYFFGDTVHQAKVNSATERSAYAEDPRGSEVPMWKKIRRLEKKVPTRVLRKYERLIDKEDFKEIAVLCESYRFVDKLFKAQEIQVNILEAIRHDRRMLANCY